MIIMWLDGSSWHGCSLSRFGGRGGPKGTGTVDRIGRGQFGY